MAIETKSLINGQVDQILDYNQVGVTFSIPKPIVAQNGIRNMAHVIDGVAVVDRDYDFKIDYDNYPDFYNAFVTANMSGGPGSMDGYTNGFKSDESTFHRAVEIPENETIRFVEMSANSLWVVCSKPVGGNIVETARWTNDPYLVDFTFSTNSAGKVVITNTYSATTGQSTPVSKMGRPVRNTLTGRWYIPIEFSTYSGGVGRIYELNESNGAVVQLSPSTRPGGYQVRRPDTIDSSNKSTAMTLQSGIMYPSRWTWSSTIDNPSMFYWKGKMLMTDYDGNLVYNTTDMLTWQIIPAPPTGAMFYIVDRTDGDNRLIAVGMDAASSYNNLFIWELRAIAGSWTKVGTIVNGGFMSGYTGKLLSVAGAGNPANHYTPNLGTTPMPIPHLTTLNLGGLTSFQIWYPSGTVSINRLSDVDDYTELTIPFAYYHSGYYNAISSGSEVTVQVETEDTYPLLITTTLKYPEDSSFDVNNSPSDIIRKRIRSYAVTATGSTNLNASYVNLRSDHGLIMSRKHFMFSDRFTHFQVSGIFPTSTISEISATASFRFIPIGKALVDFPGRLYPLYDEKLLGRRGVFTYNSISRFYSANDFDPATYFAQDRNNFVGQPVYRAFAEMYDPTVLHAGEDDNGVNDNTNGIIATGVLGKHVVFSGPMCETIGISTPGTSTNLIWLLGVNLNRREPFTLNRLLDYTDLSNRTLFTIVG